MQVTAKGYRRRLLTHTLLDWTLDSKPDRGAGLTITSDHHEHCVFSISNKVWIRMNGDFEVTLRLTASDIKALVYLASLDEEARKGLLAKAHQ